MCFHSSESNSWARKEMVFAILFFFSFFFLGKFLSPQRFYKSVPVYLFIFLNLFFYFWLCWFYIAARGLSLVAGSRGYSSLWCAGFSLRWLLLLQSTGSRCTVFSSCGTWAQYLWLAGSRAQAR